MMLINHGDITQSSGWPEGLQIYFFSALEGLLFSVVVSSSPVSFPLSFPPSLCEVLLCFDFPTRVNIHFRLSPCGILTALSDCRRHQLVSKGEHVQFSDCDNDHAGVSFQPHTHVSMMCVMLVLTICSGVLERTWGFVLLTRSQWRRTISHQRSFLSLLKEKQLICCDAIRIRFSIKLLDDEEWNTNSFLTI